MRSNKTRLLQLPWRSRARIARDIDAELNFHLETRIGELTAHGLDPDEARRRAQDEFGDIEFTRAYCRNLDEQADRATRTADRVSEWRQDAHYALRTLRRSPGFAALSLITLALAIGANTAIFSVARAVLLEPLPYGEPDALVRVFESWPGNPEGKTPLAPANFADYQAQQHAFTDIGAYEGMGSVTWRPESGDPQTLTGLAVAPNFFDVLRVRPLHGRGFAPGEGNEGNDLKVVVSYGFWQRSLGGDVSKIGQHITLNGRSYDLIGVMPRGFTLGADEDLWMPLGLNDVLADAGRARKQHYIHAIARLKPGMTMAAATADLLIISRRLQKEYPDADTDRIAILTPLRDMMIGDLRPALLLLQGAAAMVLLIACANLANLTLSRTMGRRREMALRAALGAGRGRLVRQLLTESVLLAVAGGVLGVGVAMGATRAMLALNPNALPDMFTAAIDGPVLLFSMVLSIATGVLFGLVPALDAARVNLHDSLKEGGRGTSVGHAGERVRRALVVAQVGLAVMLLIGAGLLVRSFSKLTSVRLGFDSSSVLTVELRATGEKYDSAATINHFFDGVLGEIAAAPGVVAVGAADVLPMRGSVGTSLRVVGEATDERNLPDIRYVGIRGEYFKALRIPLKAGRMYDASDAPKGPKTVIVNEAALRFFPNGQAIGRRIRIGPAPTGDGMLVVGVVGDIRAEKADAPPVPMLFANHRQEAWERTMSVVVRTAGNPLSASALIRRVVHDNDPTLALRDITTLDDVVGARLAPRRFALALAACFAVVALILAAVGIYGVLSYTVTTRTREFGVRIALGATARSVVMLVVRQGLGWSLVGLALGVGGAIAGGRLLSGMLFGVSALDVSTYVSVVIGLLVVVVTACMVPASRATRVDPLTSMRAE